MARAPRRFDVRRRAKSRQISVSSGLRWEIDEIERARRREANVDLTCGIARPCPLHVHTARNRTQPTKCARTAPGRAWTMVPPSAPFCAKGPKLKKTQNYHNYGFRGGFSTTPGVFHTSGARCGTQ